MENKEQPDLLDTQPLQETDDELTAEIDYCEIMSEEEKEELKNELVKLEDEIVTLRQVLAAKEKHLAEIKHKLGVSMMNELKQNFSRSWHDVQTHSAENISEAYQTGPIRTGSQDPKCQQVLSAQEIPQPKTISSAFFGPCQYKKTQETLSQAGMKASAALTNVGSAIGKKLGDMRNSPTFKSFEERVENTVTSLRAKVGAPNQTQGSFEEVLSSTAHASAHSSLAGTLLPEAEEDLQC
ncbi:tumor D53 isoform X2 [Pelobates cultripes]|uniref:Tumor D53 isoform X2 n=1 Tax=Pelobates cultripes TaxID=61616 RepID=A0AAD1RE52_PELCU|nr:tumor D53 isoform X2 [Pelobates cultripes]